jgi:putative ATP-binding cassette transporter
MSILHFLSHEAQAPRATILTMAGISGATNILMIVLVNSAAEQVGVGAIQAQLLALYLVAFGIYVVSQHYARTRAVAAINSALQHLRLRVVEKVRRSELRFIEKNDGIGAYAPLLYDSAVVTRGAMILVAVSQSLLVLIMASIYLIALSPASLTAMLLIYAILLPSYVRSWRRTRSQLLEADHKEGELLEQFSSLLHGFKELKLNQPESNAFFGIMETTAADACRLKISCNLFQVRGMILRRMINYSALFAVVFVVPAIVPASAETILKVTATVLFILAPLTVFIDMLPALARIDAAVVNLYELEDRLDRAMASSDGLPSSETLPTFRQIELGGVVFRYGGQHGEPQFAVGPLDLRLNQGERLFIVGGNGSGKSTLLKILTGLYPPEQGEVRLDGRPLTDVERPRYRSLFTSVFTDFHLFESLYGVPDIDPAVVNAGIAELGLARETYYTADGFTNLDLTASQRKRLALLASMLKDRPICVFDELAADQDPEFRRRFYEDILPRLSAGGRTLVVVSHDDQYFRTADRVLRVNRGKISGLKTPVAGEKL